MNANLRLVDPERLSAPRQRLAEVIEHLRRLDAEVERAGLPCANLRAFIDDRRRATADRVGQRNVAAEAAARAIAAGESIMPVGPDMTPLCPDDAECLARAPVSPGRGAQPAARTGKV